MRTDCNNIDPKIFSQHRHLPNGTRKSATNVHYLQTQFVENRCTQFPVIVVKDPPKNTHALSTKIEWRPQAHFLKIPHFPLKLRNGAGVRINSNDGAMVGSLNIGLVVLIKYWSVTDRHQPDTLP